MASLRNLSEVYNVMYSSALEKLEESKQIEEEFVVDTKDSTDLDSFMEGVFEQMFDDVFKFKKETPKVIKEEKETSKPIRKVIKEEESIEYTPQRSYIEEVGDNLSRYIKKSNSNNSVKEDYIEGPDNQYKALELQVKQLRQMVIESAQRHTPTTLVNAIGSGGVGTTPGSGEVNIRNMDDIAKGAQWKVGDTLVWTGKNFAPGKGAQATPVGLPVGAIPPTNPIVGDLWFNTNTLNTFIYVEDANGHFDWIDANQ